MAVSAQPINESLVLVVEYDGCDPGLHPLQAIAQLDRIAAATQVQQQLRRHKRHPYTRRVLLRTLFTEQYALNSFAMRISISPFARDLSASGIGILVPSTLHPLRQDRQAPTILAQSVFRPNVHVAIGLGEGNVKWVTGVVQCNSTTEQGYQLLGIEFNKSSG